MAATAALLVLFLSFALSGAAGAAGSISPSPANAGLIIRIVMHVRVKGLMSLRCMILSVAA